MLCCVVLCYVMLCYVIHYVRLGYDLLRVHKLLKLILHQNSRVKCYYRHFIYFFALLATQRFTLAKLEWHKHEKFE